LRIFAAAVAALTCAALAGFVLLTDPGDSASAAARTSTPTPTRTPRATPTPLPRPEPAIGPGLMTASCTSANTARAVLLWQPSRGGTQYVDLSIFNDGFAPGTFISAGPFDRGTWGYAWDGLWPGVTHFVRVNTLTSQGWKPSHTLAFYTPDCNPAAEPAPAADMLGLRDRIAGAISASGIDTAVAVTDLRTGETIDVQGDDPRLPGCTINLFVLLHVVTGLQAGRFAEPEAGDLIGQTINRSDPITARTLLRYWVGDGDVLAGARRVNDLTQALGMRSTLMDHPPAFWSESLNGGRDNVITARDANRGLRAIWDGRLLTPGWRDYLLRKMTLVKPGLNYLLPAGVGYGATVSHKNGFLWAEGWADNDIGIVWFERGGQRYGYALSFFTEGVPTKYADIPMGQRVSSLAWQWFVGRYGYP
jgi:hypothetical protein